MNTTSDFDEFKKIQEVNKDILSKKGKSNNMGKTKLKNKTSSLSKTHACHVGSMRHYQESSSSKNDCSSFGERISLFTSYRLKRPAVLTVETAIVLPMFLMICISLLYFIEIFRIETTIQSAMFRTGRFMSQSLYLYQLGDSSEESILTSGMKGISILTMQEMVMEKATAERLEKSCIVNGSKGLSFWHSNVMDDWIDIIVEYKVKLPFFVVPLPEMPIVQRCRIRGWTGTDGLADMDLEEDVVYMTPNGSVYHTNKDCTHLKLSITTVLFETMGNLRNNNGAKYYACEICVKGTVEQLEVYITFDGTRYHKTLTCSGLKRQILVIPVSEINGIRICSRCDK